jgi:hypothetical protein
MYILISSLNEVDVIICSEVEWFPERGLPSNLKSINIYASDKVIAGWMGGGLQNLSFLGHLAISGNSKDVESLLEALLLPTSLTSLSISGFPNLK